MNLPPPLKITTPKNYTQQELKNLYDLEAMHKSFKEEYERLVEYASVTPMLSDDFINPTQELYQLIDRDIWRTRGLPVIKKFIGWSKKYQSLTISLFDAQSIKAICIRRAKDKDGNPIKWKTYGSKQFIPYRIFDPEDPTIFIAFGIGEFLLMELLGFNYMILQSDSIAKTLSNNPYTPKTEGRYIFVLLDNDESCKATLEPLKEHFNNSFVYGIDFENMLDKELPKGYDFRDFCNDIAKEIRGDSYLANPQEIKEAIVNTIANEIKTILGAK